MDFFFLQFYSFELCRLETSRFSCFDVNCAATHRNLLDVYWGSAPLPGMFGLCVEEKFRSAWIMQVSSSIYFECWRKSFHSWSLNDGQHGMHVISSTLTKSNSIQKWFLRRQIDFWASIKGYALRRGVIRAVQTLLFFSFNSTDLLFKTVADLLDYCLYSVFILLLP